MVCEILGPLSLCKATLQCNLTRLWAVRSIRTQEAEGGGEGVEPALDPPLLPFLMLDWVAWLFLLFQMM